MPAGVAAALLIIWFGIGEVAKVVIIVLALFPILSISAMQAVRSVGRRKVQAAMALGASRTMIFRRVIFPASLPGIFTSVRVSIGLGVTMLVGAEMIATSAGIAFMAMSASDFLLTNVVIVGALMMATLGYTLDLCARALENHIVHWGGEGRLRRRCPDKEPCGPSCSKRCRAPPGDDVDWRNGRVPMFIHYAGDDVLDVAKQAYLMYFSENGLGLRAFRSLARFESEVVQMGLGLLHGGGGKGRDDYRRHQEKASSWP
ncbi:MAG: ABC transporter permease subunit [Ideonella sp.]|nr:ABC transporter permease subunit [Ideonella sp.]